MRLNAFRSPRNIARNVSGITAGITLSLLYVATAAAASPSAAVPDAAASDPARLGWMVGSPPPPDRTLRFEDGSYFQFPAMRWSVSHFRQLMPTVNISRGLGAPVALPRQDSVALNQRIDALRFVPLGAAEPMTWEQSLAANYTDGIVVLHRGRVVYERYFGSLQQDGQHAAMSVTKSVIGTLGATLVAEGKIDAGKRVADYVPELASSAFGSATVRQVLDMTTGLKYSEDYADPTRKSGSTPRPAARCPSRRITPGRAAILNFCKRCSRKVSMVTALHTRPSIPMCSAGSLPAPPAAMLPSCCRSASGVASERNRMPT